MPTKYCIDGAYISCYMIGESGSGTEALIPEGVTPVMQNYDEIKGSLSTGQLFEDPYFPTVKASIAYNPEEKDNELSKVDDIEWLRPAEILKAKGVEGTPVFVDNGGDPEKVGDPNDVNQNLLGDCWFLCSMAEISRLPDIFWMVVCRENLTQFNTDEYRGIFKFRFAAFGRLIEVVVDDRLPYLPGENSYWSVEADNPLVFWSCLMEKAYAKLYSSYQAIQGGNIGDALQDFTGGVIDRYSDIGDMQNEKLWTLVTDASKAKFYMGASVMKDLGDDKAKELKLEKAGLANYHAYSLLTTKVVEIKEKKYRLLRLRNPWGNEVEFKGKFNEKRGALWKKLDAETKTEFPANDDGEFWMTLREFRDNFGLVEIVNLNPFGSDGKSLEELCEEVNFTRKLKDGKWTADNSFGPLGGFDGGDADEDEQDDGKGEEKNEDENQKDEEAAADESKEHEQEEKPVPERDEASDKQSPDAEADEEEEEDDDAEPGEEEEERVYTEEEYNNFCKNPQIKFTVPEVDLDEDGKSQVVISLLQRYRRNLHKSGAREVSIGFAVAKVQTAYPVTGTEIFNDKSNFENFDGESYRSHTVRSNLIPGEYVVIPYNSENVFGGFTIIVFTKK